MLLLWTLLAALAGVVSGGCHEEVIHSVQEYCNADKQIKILAYNIQVFGTTKMGKPDVVKSLLDTCILYDLIMVQEIRDTSGTAIVDFITQLNAKAGKERYSHAICIRQGRTSSKEQIAYVYDKELLAVEEIKDWPDPPDHFERDPCVVRFNVVQRPATVEKFVIIGIHITPGDVSNELNALYDVHDEVKAQWGTDEIIMMGDFNAGCSYLSKTATNALRLRQDTRFKWLIGDDADTTVGSTPCAYDRFIVTGAKLKQELRYAGVYDVAKEQGITDADFEKAISDHQPIEMKLM